MTIRPARLPEAFRPNDLVGRVGQDESVPPASFGRLDRTG